MNDVVFWEAIRKLFGRYVHDERCAHVQMPNGQCDCERGALHARVLELKSKRPTAQVLVSMSEFFQSPPLNTATFKLEIYKGSGEQLFLRVSERSDKYDEWSEACLSAKEAEQLRAFLDTCLPLSRRDGHVQD